MIKTKLIVQRTSKPTLKFTFLLNSWKRMKQNKNVPFQIKASNAKNVIQVHLSILRPFQIGQGVNFLK